MAFVSCGVDKQNIDKQNNGVLLGSGYFNQWEFKTTEIDHCEYLVYASMSAGIFSITHKGNCKNHKASQTGQSSSINIDGTNGNKIEVNQGNK